MQMAELEASDAVRAYDLPRLQACVEQQPDLAWRDDVRIPLYSGVPMVMHMPLLAIAIHHAVHASREDTHNALAVLDWVAERYSAAHPRGTPMPLMIFNNGGDVFQVRTPQELVLGHIDINGGLNAAVACMRLADKGLVSARLPHQRQSVLRKAIVAASRFPAVLTHLVQAGERFTPGEADNADAIVSICEAFINAPYPANVVVARLVACLRAALLPAYAGRVTDFEAHNDERNVMVRLTGLLRWLAFWRNQPLDEFVDVLRTLGLRLTPAVRAQLALLEDDPNLLQRIDASDAVRVRRTLMARRALSRLPDDVRDRVALQASGGQPYAQQLIVVPHLVRLAHNAAAEADAQL
jgi:hypothetical protein